MNGFSAKLGGKLDAAYQVQSFFTRPRQSAVVAGQCVVIGDRQSFQADCHGRVDQFEGTVRAVRFVRVRV